jgi:hypothetical protein
MEDKLRALGALLERVEEDRRPGAISKFFIFFGFFGLTLGAAKTIILVARCKNSL